MFLQYSKVVLLRDDPESGLQAGALGYVVEVYSQPREAYTVDFINDRGENLALLDLYPKDLKAAE